MRSWFFLLGYFFQRQTRARTLTLVSLGLLALVSLLVALNTRFDRWSMLHWRMTVTFEFQPSVRAPLREILQTLETPTHLPTVHVGAAAPLAVVSAVRAVSHQAAGPRLFTASVLVGLLASFLMPLWTLSFATESIGRARESRTLTWLLLRPVPRWAIVLAAYFAALPGALALNLGGYFLFCSLAGDPGRFARPLFPLAIILGTLAFTALFLFLSIAFQRAGILGLLYAFFFETIAGNLPGQQKRLSISYYVRCLMVDRADDAGLTLNLGGVRPPVTGDTAIAVLIVATLALLVAGVVIFSRKEYVENAGA